MTRATGHLLNATGISRLLSMSRQRVLQLIEDDPAFPSPVAILGRSPVWEQETIAKWADQSGRSFSADDRFTWIQMRRPLPEGSAPSTEPMFVVHLASGSMHDTLCGIEIKSAEISQAGFVSIAPRNRCDECSRIEQVVPPSSEEDYIGDIEGRLAR